VLIPASFLAACKIENEIELRLDGSRIVIEPARTPRSGWFDTHDPETDEDVWPTLPEDEDGGDVWWW